MQSSDVVVLGRGSRYGGNVAFLPQDRAVIEILPLGLDPTPAADVAQALDLRYVDCFLLRGRGRWGVWTSRKEACPTLYHHQRFWVFWRNGLSLFPLLVAHSPSPVSLAAVCFRYHFVVTPPRPLADVSRCNGRNGSFVQAYGLLASEWERRDGLGTSRAQWDHDSLQCIMVGVEGEGMDMRESKTLARCFTVSWPFLLTLFLVCLCGTHCCLTLPPSCLCGVCRVPRCCSTWIRWRAG